MGYRSNVTIYMCYPKAHEDVKAAMGSDKAGKWLTEEVMDGNIKFSPPETEVPWVLMQFDYIKWYDDFEEIQAVQELYDEAERAEDSNCAFLRIGEEHDDIEYTNQGYGCEVVYPNTVAVVELQEK